jgi:hypothetical protein
MGSARDLFLYKKKTFCASLIPDCGFLVGFIAPLPPPPHHEKLSIFVCRQYDV